MSPDIMKDQVQVSCSFGLSMMVQGGDRFFFFNATVWQITQGGASRDFSMIQLQADHFKGITTV